MRVTKKTGLILLLFVGLFLLNTLLPSGAFAANWYHTGLLYRQKITINSDHTDFSLSGDLTGFPVLIQITPPTTNPLFGRAQPDGDDILFTASDGTTKIPHEIEYYNDSGGSERIDAWVKVPSFYSGSDTVIYMYYGNASASNQQDPENVWDSDFKGVWHLDEQVTDEQATGKHYDSTINSYDGNQNGNEGKAPGSTPAPKIGGAQNFDGTDDLVNVDNVDSDEWTGLTESAWAHPTGYTSDPRIICKADSGTPDTHIFSLTLDETSATTGRLRVRLNTDNALGNPTGYAQFMGTYVTGVDKWYYLVFTWNSATGDAIMYVYADGVLQEKLVNSKAGVTIADAQVVHDVIIGNVSLDDSRWWLGNLDEIHLSSAPRSDDWIKAEYYSQYDPGKYQGYEEEIFIAGTVYSDEGITCIGAGKTVALSINGGTNPGTNLFSGVTDTNGRYEITIPTFPTSRINADDKLIVFLDGETEKGATVTVSDGGRMNNLDIYEDHVIVRNDNGPNMSNSLMGPAHNGDGDIPYSFSDPHVTIANGFTLLVTEGEAFQQDGNVTVGSTAAANLKIQGDWDAASTLAVKGDITGSGNLNGGSASVDIDGEITISTYTATSGTTSVGGDWNVENFTHSSGTVVFDGTGTVTGDSFYTFHVNAPGFTRSVSGDLTVENQLILSAGTFDSGSGNHSVAGIWNDTGITFQPSSGTIILTSASPSIVQGGANNFYNLEITNGATLGSVIDVNGDLTITSGTLNSGSNTIEVAAGWSNSGSFSAGTGTVIFDDASTTSVITGQTVFNNFTCTTPGKALQFEANKKQTVNGIFTITGSNTSFITLGSTATGVNWEIDAASESVQYASVQDSSAYTIISADDSVDGGNNTNWTFDSSNYWIWEGSADTDWSNPANWSKGSVPAGAGSRAIIATAAQRMPVLTADISGGSAPDYLTIESGSTVDTAGYNLTPLTQLQNFGTIRRKAGDVVTSDPDSGAVVYYGEVLSSSDIETYPGDDYYNLVFEGLGITFTSGADVTVVNDLTVSSGILDMDPHTMSVGNDLTVNAAGTVQAGSGTLSIGGDLSGLGTLEGESATIDIGGSITINNYQASSATTGVAGNWYVDSFIPGSGTVQFNGDGTVSSESFYNLQIISGTRTATGALTIVNDLSISAGALLTVGSYDLIVQGNVSGAGTLDGGSATIDVDGNSGVSNYTATSETTYVGGNWNVAGSFIPSAGNVVFDGSSTLGASTTFYNLTIQSGASLDTQGNSLWINGTYDNQGTLYRQGGDYVSTPDSDSGTTVYTTTGGNIQTYTGEDYYNLTISQALQTFTLPGSITIQNNITITAGTLDSASNDITVGGSGSNAAGASGFTAGSGTVIFEDVGITSVISGSTTFNNFTCTTPGKTIRFTAGSTQGIQGAFIVRGEQGNLVTLESTSSGSQWNIINNGDAEDVEYAAVQDSNNLAAAKIITAYSSKNNTGNTNWSFTGVIRSWKGSTSSWTTASNWDPGDNYPQTDDSVIILSGYTTPVLSGDVTVKDLEIKSAGTLDILGHALDVTNTFENQGTLKRYGMTSELDDKVTKTDFDSGTVMYHNTGGYVQDYGSQDYYNIIFDGSVVFTMSKALDATNNLQINTGATLDSGGKFITVSRNWSNSGTFTHGSSTVFFDDATKTSVISGNTSFYNFTCNTPGKTIQFTAGSRQTINGSFTIQGESGNYVKLTSSSDWELDNVGNTEDIDYADVEYSDASVGSGNTVDAVNSNNRGNNTNWSFTGTGDFFTWTGNSDADWNDGGNWDQAAVPGLGDTVIIPDVSPKPQPIMDLTSVTIKNLTIQSGASLDTGGNSLTITGNYDNQGTLYRMGSDYVSQTDIDSGTVVYRISGGSIQNYNYPGSDYYNLAIDSETFSISGKLEVALDLNFTSGGTLDLGSYSLTVSGDVTGTGNLGGGTSTVDINGSILVSGYTASSGITYVAGDWGVTNFNHNSGTVIFDGTSSQNVGTGTFWNLQVSIGSCTAVGALTIQNNISIGESGTLDGNGQTISVGGNWSNSGSFTHSSSTVAIIDSGKTTVISGDNTFHNFSCSTAGKTIQFTASETQTIQGSFTIQGALGALISLESTAGGTQWRIDNAGDAEDVDFAAIQDSNNVAGPTKIIIADDSIDNGNNLNWTINLIEKIWVGGTVGSETSWNTDGNWNPSGVPTAAYSIVIPSGQTYMPIIDVATVTIKNLTIESGASLSIQGNIINITNSFENQGTLYRQGDDSVSLTDSDSGLVVYKNSGGTIQSGYPGTDYYRLQINEPSAVFTLGDNLEVADDLTVADGTLSAGSYTITVAGDWSVAAGAFFNKGTGSVILNNTLEQSLESGGSAFYNLTKQGGSRLVITTNPLTVTGTLSISSGSDTVDMNNLGFTINTLVNNGTLELDGTQGTQSISSMDTDSGLVLYNGASGGIIRLIDFYNLEINRNARTFTLFDAVDINGDITITAGTLKTNSNTITVAGDWTNSGNFTAGSGTVVLDTTGPATISGNTGFYDLSCTTAGKTIQFAAGSTNNVSGTFNIQGVLGNHITHGSTSPGTAWKLNVVSSIVSFATVQDSDASGGNKVYASDSTDNGNNTNWDFNPGIVITSRSTEDYGSNAGQIDRIKLTAFEALNDDFSNISVKVSGYGTYSAPGDFETGTPLDNVFYVKISESGSPDTGVTPAVQITVNTSLKDNATGIKPVVTDPSAVTPADNAAPILTNASIASDNADSSLAKIGDTVTIAITASETLGGLPSVTIDGNAAAVVSTGGNSYEATRVMQAGDTEGVVAFTIDFADAVGNTGIQVTATTDASSVTFDETIPILNNVSITSNNANSALAIAGNTVTISFTSNETLIWSPAVTIDGNPADTVNDLGGNNYSATRVMQLGDTEGVIAFMIDFADSAGNAGAQVTVTTDSSSVSYDESAPQINISSLEEDNLYVDITFSEGVYNTSSGSGALETTDFAIIFIQNGGGATGVTIANVTKNDNNTLLGGETIVRVHLNISGYPSGDETIEITPADGSSIFDAAGNPVQVTETTGILTLNEQPLAEGKVIIRNNIINPKRGEKTTINFRLDKSTKVNITVYDLNGDPVKVLYNRVAGAPLNEAVWDGKNKRGRAVVQGVYFVVVKIGKERFVKKVLVVR